MEIMCFLKRDQVPSAAERKVSGGENELFASSPELVTNPFICIHYRESFSRSSPATNPAPGRNSHFQACLVVKISCVRALQIQAQTQLQVNDSSVLEVL